VWHVVVLTLLSALVLLDHLGIVTTP